MSTILQQELAREIIRNTKRPIHKRKNKKELVVSSGYDETSADKHSKSIIESKGTTRELKKLGFDTDSAKSVIKDILSREIDGKLISASDKINASREVFKVLGEYAPEKQVIAIGRIPLKNDEVEKIKKEAEEKLKNVMLD